MGRSHWKEPSKLPVNSEILGLNHSVKAVYSFALSHPDACSKQSGKAESISARGAGKGFKWQRGGTEQLAVLEQPRNSTFYYCLQITHSFCAKAEDTPIPLYTAQARAKVVTCVCFSPFPIPMGVLRNPHTPHTSLQLDHRAVYVFSPSPPPDWGEKHGMEADPGAGRMQNEGCASFGLGFVPWCEKACHFF